MYMQEISAVLIVSFPSILTLFMHLLVRYLLFSYELIYLFIQVFN